MISKTDSIVSEVVKNPNIKIFDCPGFSDTQNPDEMDQLVQDRGIELLINDSKSAAIDAILVVAKCAPRATTISADVNKLRDMWGKRCYKSIIFIIVTPDSHYNMKDEDVFN